MRVLLAVSLLWVLVVNGYALEMEGVKVPNSYQIGKEELVLNGAGIRKATWFKVKVYVGALYLVKKTSDAATFLKSEHVKFITMQFIRNLSADKLQNGWTEAFGNALEGGRPLLAKLKPQIDEFNSYMPDLVEGDRIEITFFPERVELKVKQGKRIIIKGRQFSRALLSIWFINASDEGLRDGLLGKQ